MSADVKAVPGAPVGMAMTMMGVFTFQRTATRPIQHPVKKRVPKEPLCQNGPVKRC